MVVLSRERVRAVAAVALLVLLLAPSLPAGLAQGVTTPDPTGTDPSNTLGRTNAYALSIPQGDPRIWVNQSGKSGVAFLDGNKTFEIAFPIENDGTQASPQLPVYYWFQENDSVLDCIKLPGTVPAATNSPRHVPGVRMVEISGLRLPTTVLDADTDNARHVVEYHLNVLLNREPIADGVPRTGFRASSTQQSLRTDCGSVDYGSEDGTQRTRGSVGSAPVTSASTAAYSDFNASDNLLVIHLIKDAKMDLRVKSVQWCHGDESVIPPDDDDLPSTTTPEVQRPACKDNLVDADDWLMGTRAYNTSRQNETPRQRNVTNNDPGETFDVDNSTFFLAEVVNDPGTEETPSNATWNRHVAGRADYDLDHTTCSRNGSTDRSKWWLSNITISRAKCDPFAFGLEFRVTAEGTNAHTGVGEPLASAHVETIAPTATTDPITRFRSKNFELYQIADRFGTGRLQVLANANPLNNPPETVSTTNNALVHPFEVAWTDLTGNFTLDTIKVTPADPYPFPSPGQRITIAGSLELRNLGPARPLYFEHADLDNDYDRGVAKLRPIAWRVTIDNRTDDANATFRQNFVEADFGNATHSPACPTADPCEDPALRRAFSLRMTASNDPRTGLTPGIHGLCLQVDLPHPRPAPSDVAPVPTTQNETNEKNNEHCVAIYVADTSAPVFEAIEGSVQPRISRTTWNGTAVNSVYANQSFSVAVNVSDDDQAGLTVTASFQLKTNESVYRNYTMRNLPSLPGYTKTYSVSPPEFNITNASVSSENWTLRVTARDAFGNEVESDALNLRVDRWPIHTKNASHVVFGILNETGGYYPEDSTFPYTSDVSIRYVFEVFDNETGVEDQSNRTENFNLTVFAPGKEPFTLNGTRFTKSITCEGGDDIPLPGQRQAPAICSNMNRFQTPAIEKNIGDPGRWYIHLEIKDKGGDTRIINRTFRLVDDLPILTEEQIGSAELEATQPLAVHVKMVDDFGIDLDNGGALVNFTRTRDNKTFSFELTNETVVGNCASPPCGYSFNDTITTGFGNQLDEAGDFLVSFVARDLKGNWNQTPGIPFKLNDTEAPVLQDAAVDQALQELNVDVTFTAHVTDLTNVTVFLRVHPAGSDEDTLRVNMTPTHLGSSNYTHTANFSVEGSYVWSIWAEDSAGLVSSVKNGPLTIAKNLGPRFEIRQPSTLIEGKRYARAAPQISILVYDTDNIDKDSIKLRIAGGNVTPDDVTPATGGVKGYIVNYTVPALSRFNHRDTVTVNATAIDLSDVQLEGFLTFTFVVDDSPPTARVVDFAPKHRAEERHVFWNVSLRTQFTLGAADDDGVPTGVESIHYRIYSPPTTSAETVYTGPFSLSDVRGAYTGPKNYQIQFWAVDAVGNVNRSNGQIVYETINVYVDDEPPTIDPFGTLPQGRFINVTYLPDRSGVERVTAWHSTNGGAYLPVALDFVNGVWSTVLPEGRKGDQVRYYLEAVDHVGNKDETAGNATEPYATYVVGNHIPKLALTSPTTGSVLARTVDVRWDASDEDGDALSFTLYYKAPGKTTFTELAKIDNPDARSFPLDTTTLADGEYVIRVTASDGSFVQPAETTVTIVNRASAFGTVSPVPAEVTPRTPVLLRVEVTKAQAEVEARVFRNGRFVQAYPMNDAGRDGDEVANDGKYSVRVQMDAAGDYSVQFHTTYQQGGEQKTDEVKGPTFAVKGTPADVIRAFGPWLAVIGLLAAAGVGIAAWVIVRRK